MFYQDYPTKWVIVAIQKSKKNISPTIEYKAPFSDRHNQIQHTSARMCQQYPRPRYFLTSRGVMVQYKAWSNEFNSTYN